MSTPTLRPLAVLAAWTLLVWTTRINNIWADDDLTGAGKAGRTALALAFTGLAVAALLAWWRARRDPRAVDRAKPLVVAFALWTTGVWVIRAVQIALADHSAAFVAVHTALAVVSIGLAGWAWRAVRSASSEAALVP